jgi:hypothetical protein
MKFKLLMVSVGASALGLIGGYIGRGIIDPQKETLITDTQSSGVHHPTTNSTEWGEKETGHRFFRINPGGLDPGVSRVFVESVLGLDFVAIDHSRVLYKLTKTECKERAAPSPILYYVEYDGDRLRQVRILTGDDSFGNPARRQ